MSVIKRASMFVEGTCCPGRSGGALRIFLAMKARTICSWPGCGQAVFLPDRYCEKHQAMREKQKEEARASRDRFRGSAASRGYDYRWSQFRRRYLREHPVCVMCGRLATEVDHIIPFKGDKAKIFDLDNLQPLCHECHSRKTAKENGGFGNRLTEN